MWIWRIITIVPALLVIALNIPTVEVLVISQAILSLQLPFTMVPVVLLTQRRDLMGALVNGRFTNILNVCITLVVTVMNVLLLYTLFWG
jgi:manganese transport protein